MSETLHTQLRWPRGLRQAVVEAARNSGRSMNSEIVTRLKSTFPASELEITHGHLMPCPCGAGRPDETRLLSMPGGVQISCPKCGRGVTDLSDEVAALKWTAIVRAVAVRAAG